MTTHEGFNRSGLMTAPELGQEMIAATREFPPSSDGTSEAIAEVRVAYAQQTETPDTMPRVASAIAGETRGADQTPGDELVRLLDKLGERLAFEHAGARLYEALLSKHRAYGEFQGGPSAEDLAHILSEEYEHADLLERAIKELGGDPTALTPSANLAANVSMGLPQVLSDPRTNLLQCLEAIVVAELADNECWAALDQLARQAGHDELGEACQVAIEHERDHLRKVRAWIAIGQGRAGRDAAVTDPTDSAEDDTDEDFTFTQNSAVDPEGYAVSDEEAREDREVGDRSKTGKTGRRRATPRER
jgi:hypothetical protein